MTGLASRIAGLWSVRAPITTPQTNGAHIMSSTAIDAATPSTRQRGRRTANAKTTTKPSRKSGPPAGEHPKPAEPQHNERVTKQERMLTLLSQPEGASIAEMMQATNWLQHSVRGFLAGTVKRKLGFSLTSSKAAGDVRRYRIKTRRSR